MTDSTKNTNQSPLIAINDFSDDPRIPRLQWRLLDSLDEGWNWLWFAPESYVSQLPPIQGRPLSSAQLYSSTGLWPSSINLDTLIRHQGRVVIDSALMQRPYWRCYEDGQWLTFLRDDILNWLKQQHVDWQVQQLAQFAGVTDEYD